MSNVNWFEVGQTLSKNKEEPRFICAGARHPCNTPTDEIVFKAPYCPSCLTEVRRFRAERRRRLGCDVGRVQHH